MYVNVSKVTSKGQVTIPEAIRRKEGISTGTSLVFVTLKDGILVKKSGDFKGLFKAFEKRARELKLTRRQLGKEVEGLKKQTLQKYFK